MSKFDRGISKEFVRALNNEYEKDGWWKNLIDDKSLFLGIRDDSVDIYLNGGRVLHLEHVKGEFVGSTHFKYLVNLSRADTKNEYVRFENGSFDRVNLKDPYRHIGADLPGIKKSLTPYQGEEKEGVHKIVMHNRNVIDTEIQFSDEEQFSDEDRRKDRRVDFAALQKVDGKIKIVFFEAKIYSNSEIRHPASRSEVLKQIEEYERIIAQRRKEIQESYRQVAENIKRLKGWNSRRSNIFAESATNGLIVEPEVRLVIFNFKDPQRKAAISAGGDFARLRDAIGTHRVLAKGDPTKFVKGIKSPE